MLFIDEDLTESFSQLLTYKFKVIIIILSGRSSGVERNLAKVEVEGSNPFARSKNKVSSQKLDIVCNRVAIEFI